MDERPLPEGKIPAALLAELLGAGAAGPDVLLGPAVGEDACALGVGADAVVVATDPITLTGERAGMLAVYVNANDVAATGAEPRWFLATLLLPPGTTAGAVRNLFEEIRRALDRLGAELVGGHSEVTGAVHRPVIVGQMIGLATEGRVVATGGVRPGDRIVQVGPVPIEGAAVLAGAPGIAGLDDDVLVAARAALDDPGVLVVEPALTAARLGATSLHDPTEGGLAAGLHEMAGAARLEITVDREAVLWFEPGVAVCRALGADPWATLASGCLLAAFPPAELATALGALRAAGHAAAVIGTAGPGRGLVDGDGAPIPLPERDEVARLLAD